MDFKLSDEIRQLVDAIGKFMDREVLPKGREHHDLCDDGKFSQEVHELGAKIRKKSVDLGYYTLHMTEALGGADLSMVGLSAVTSIGLRSSACCKRSSFTRKPAIALSASNRETEARMPILCSRLLAIIGSITLS